MPDVTPARRPCTLLVYLPTHPTGCNFSQASEEEPMIVAVIELVSEAVVPLAPSIELLLRLNN